MGTDPLLAQKHLEDASRAAAAAAEDISADQEANRQSYERFYNNLALFAGGTVALSVTYLGYLKTLPKPLVHQDILIASWASLLLCLATALFYTFFHTHYWFYASVRRYLESRKEQREVEARELNSLNVVNIRSEAERKSVELRLRKAVERYEGNARSASRRESAYFFIWKWSGRLARGTFLVGLGLLFFFAVANM